MLLVWIRGIDFGILYSTESISNLLVVLIMIRQVVYEVGIVLLVICFSDNSMSIFTLKLS